MKSPITMILSVTSLVLCFSYLASANPSFTLLEIDNHPCKPENLKKTDRYICDSKGNVICQSGWRNPSGGHDFDIEMNPCLEPICDSDGQDCQHGDCRAPDQCACEIGWEGDKCDKCVKLPGCKHGNCSEAFQCSCQQGWEGSFCDKPQCGGCINGFCVRPNTCRCHEGWTGPNCETCIPRSGCKHGFCGLPHTCICQESWRGLLCDEPVCNKSCIHGQCVEGNGGQENFCLCDSGWKGEDCSQCVPYWRCPNNGSDACQLPNQCFCHEDLSLNDPENLCNNLRLNTFQRGHDQEGDHHQFRQLRGGSRRGEIKDKKKINPKPEHVAQSDLEL